MCGGAERGAQCAREVRGDDIKSAEIRPCLHAAFATILPNTILFLTPACRAATVTMTPTIARSSARTPRRPPGNPSRRCHI